MGTLCSCLQLDMSFCSSFFNVLRCLVAWPPPAALQAACQRLLGPLARRWGVSRLLVASSAWASLTGAIGEGAPGICQLAASVQRRLVQVS